MSLRLAYADLPELVIGAAGEHFACADLLLAGLPAFLTTQTCAYDVAAEYRGRLVRVQVKATCQPRPLAQRGQKHVTGYVWNLRRGKGADRPYASGTFDAVAVVALDSRQVGWLLPSDVRQTFIIPVSGNKTVCKTFADYPLTRLLESIQ